MSTVWSKTMRAIIGATFFAVALTAMASPADAQGTCQRLWVERNSIYKAAGYCFNTQRGIRYFGNAGCSYDNVRDVPLSDSDRSRIAQIVAQERSIGCN
jgi:YARHG domain